MADAGKKSFNLQYETNATGIKSDLVFEKDQGLFAQNEPSDAVYFIQSGSVKVSVVSEVGKEAVIAILNANSFCGEGCLAGQDVRMSSAIAMTKCVATRVEKAAFAAMLRTAPLLTAQFTAYLLRRNIRVEADFVDQLFNSSEKRLARLLLILANFGKDEKPVPVLAAISHQTLAEMIGTTRSRVSFFMNKFRHLGFINYNGHIEVYSSLLNVVLHDGLGGHDNESS